KRKRHKTGSIKYIIICTHHCQCSIPYKHLDSCAQTPVHPPPLSCIQQVYSNQRPATTKESTAHPRHLLPISIHPPSSTQGPRNQTSYSYSINHKALINVISFKLGRIRDMLESRDKNEAHPTNEYHCPRCKRDFTGLEDLFDPL